jgi:zinc transport system substrate-binding protein
LEVRHLLKRLLGFLLLAGLCFGLSACGAENTAPGESAEESSDRISIVTTVFPEYDWTRQILGDRLQDTDLRLLCNGVDMHSYQPSVDDMTEIAECDLFIYVGGESDDWAEAALENSTNPRRRVINLLDVLGSSAREEEYVEGMSKESGEEGEAEDEPEMDEHVWLSLKNAQLFTEEISKALSETDPDHAQEYAANAAAYIDSLRDLDAAYQTAAGEGRVSTLLFGDRFPFLYLVKDYGLSYYAAFAGCSAETEASFETIAFLAGKAKELDLHTILRIEGEGNRIAQTIAQNTSFPDEKVAVMNSMQGISLADIESGATYLGIMQENLSVLQEALK